MVFYKMGVLEDEKKPYFKGEKSTKRVICTVEVSQS